MFDFLKDQNEQAAQDRIRARLQADPDAFLDACRSTCASACASSLAEQLERIDPTVVNHLSSLSLCAHRCVDDFPMPRGVFVTAEDRRNAYLHLMDALPALQRLTAEFLQIERLADKRRHASLSAAQLLHAALLATRKDTRASLPYASLFQTLKAEDERADALLSLSRRHTELLVGFSKKTVISFFVRAEQVADLKNQGQAADPAGTANLLDRLGREADLLADEILLTQKKKLPGLS